MLGAALAGCYYAPVNVEAPASKLQMIVKAMSPDIILAGPALAESLVAAAPNAAVLDPQEASGAPLSGNGRRHEIAYIIFTSGTTGTPKGVVIPRTALDHYIDWVRGSGTITADDRVAQFSNIAFDVSVTDIYGTFCAGGTLCPVVGRVDRMYPARVVERERVSVWNSTPSVVSLMSWAGEATPTKLGSLRLVNMCGEPFLPSHLAALFAAVPDAIVQNTYGPTETTVTMTLLQLNRDTAVDTSVSSIAIGEPIERMGIQLVGGAHADEGEIVVTGPQLALGYWQDEARTAAAFKMIQVAGRPQRGYFSGDWAERRNGQIFFRERIDLQVKINGMRLELDEVAHAIREAGYPVACVLKWRNQLAAVIERQADRALDQVALRAALAVRLERHAIPTLMCEVDLLPRSLNDKLDRAAVGQWLDTQEPAAAAHA
jgi:D-alanine--poly(phosphoribitol) ligase subunit 1